MPVFACLCLSVPVCAYVCLCVPLCASMCLCVCVSANVCSCVPVPVCLFLCAGSYVPVSEEERKSTSVLQRHFLMDKSFSTLALEKSPSGRTKLGSPKSERIWKKQRL